MQHLVDENARLREQLKQYQQKEKVLKKVFTQLADALEIKEGKMPSMSKLVQIFGPALLGGNQEKIKDKFSFMAEIMPLIEQYTSENDTIH